MKTKLLLFASALLGFALLCTEGCKKTLEVGGAYAPAIVSTNAVTGAVTTNIVNAPDLAFYQIDSGFMASYASVDAVFTWERDNRAFLWGVSPNIKHTLDQARPTAAALVKNYGVARQAYKANPTPAGLDLLKTILAKLQALQAAANAVSTNIAATPK